MSSSGAVVACQYGFSIPDEEVLGCGQAVGAGDGDGCGGLPGISGFLRGVEVSDGLIGGQVNWQYAILLVEKGRGIGGYGSLIIPGRKGERLVAPVLSPILSLV